MACIDPAISFLSLCVVAFLWIFIYLSAIFVEWWTLQCIILVSLSFPLILVFYVLQAEVDLLGDLSHPNLVKLIGFCIEDDQRLLVYEFMPRGSLENHLFRSTQQILYFLCSWDNLSGTQSTPL